MSITKQKIFFDSGAPTENDLIGAYITNTSIAVTASDLDIRDLTHVSDSVKIGDGTDFLAVAADGSIAVTDNGTTLSIDDGAGSITVDASDLDIRDLTHVSDSVKIGDGTDFLAIAADGSIAVTDNGTTLSIDDGAGSITVDASDLDIRDLTHASDSVKIGDGTDFLAVNADGSINVNVAEDVSNGVIKSSAATVGAVAAQVLASPLSGRTSLVVQNRGGTSVYIGAADVSTTNGLELPKYSNVEIAADAAAVIYMISESGNQNVRFLEIKK